MTKKEIDMWKFEGTFDRWMIFAMISGIFMWLSLLVGSTLAVLHNRYSFMIVGVIFAGIFLFAYSCILLKSILNDVAIHLDEGTLPWKVKKP